MLQNVMLRLPAVTLVLLCTWTSADGRSNPEETPEYLRQSQREEIAKAKKIERNYRIAKNLVLCVGDGMGISTLTAGRIYKGQKQGRTGEECKLSFEDFPAMGLSKTYNLDRQVADSAGTAVAMMAGVKVNMATLGVDSRVPSNKEDCSNVTEETKLDSILDMALQEGKSVGLVTTTRITHATPGAAFAHSPSRDFECDKDMKDTVNCCHVKDIARQLIEDNPNINVILGGGRRCFLEKDANGNKRLDGRNLIAEWRRDKRSRNLTHEYVSTRAGLMNVDAASTDFLLGLFSSSHMDYELQRNNDQPSLNEMTRKAIEILRKNPKGFFLLVEGGRIDHAHHVNKAHLSMGETEMFSDAVETITKMTSEHDTLVTVTADHSHVFTMSGYPARGNDLFGVVEPVIPVLGPTDGLPYLTLGYQNGPNGRLNESRMNYSAVGVNTSDINFQQSADVKMPYETHAGEDVAIFARGPMSHLFHAVHEQSYVAHVMMYSACLGDYRQACDWEQRLMRSMGDNPSAGHNAVPTLLTVAMATLVAAAFKMWVKQVA